MQLNTNVGTADRVIGIVLGVAILSAIFLIEGPERRFGLIGLVPILTAAVRFCALCTALGIRTGGAPKPAP